jgi:hypothetical protein
MNIEVRILAHNEQDFLPYALEHYKTFADKLVVYDGQSTDLTPDIARSFGAEVIPWDTGHCIDDQAAMDLKNNEWKWSDADWWIFVDADELIFSPQMPMRDLLREYDRQFVPIVKPYGWEMVSDTLPAYVPGQQIYDVVKMGARSDSYSKPALLCPYRLRETHYTAGAHGANPVLADGSRPGPPVIPADPPCYLLHYKHLGPVDRIVDEFRRDQSRLSELNRRRQWGTYGDPAEVAHNKRRDIMARVQQVVP